MRCYPVRIAVLAAIICCSCNESHLLAQIPTPWAIEGPITAIDPVRGTITVSGFTATIPPTLTIDGSISITGSDLTRLEDGNAPSRVRSIYASPFGSPVAYSGATLKAAGVVVDGVNGRQYQATDAVVELAENVVVGSLESLDVATGHFSINGVQCVMSPDERFSTDVLDAAGGPISLADADGKTGIAAGAVGYMYDNVLYVTVLELDVIRPGTVTVLRAQSVASNRNRLKVEGRASPFVAGMTVTVFDASNNSNLGTVNVILDPATGDGTFVLDARNFVRVPTQIKVVTSTGAEATSGVTAR